MREHTGSLSSKENVPTFSQGVKDCIPTLIGYISIGIAMGVVGAASQLSVLEVALLAAFPALKILALGFIYNLSAALLQPLGDSPVIGCLSTIGKSMIFVFAAVATVGLMFFLAITILIAAGNLTVMMR